MKMKATYDPVPYAEFRPLPLTRKQDPFFQQRRMSRAVLVLRERIGRSLVPLLNRIESLVRKVRRS